MCMFCRSLFVLFYFFFWPLCCLFFFDIRILITPLVSSNSSKINVFRNNAFIPIINSLKTSRYPPFSTMSSTWVTSIVSVPTFTSVVTIWVFIVSSIIHVCLYSNLNFVWCFNATFSNISAISWRPVLVVEETRGVPGENHRPWASNW